MTNNKLKAGYQYLCDNNIVINFQNYQLTELDINERKILYLDKFHVLPPDTEENIARNIDIKLELENIAKNGSCADLAEYIYELIIYTRQTTGSQMNPSCSIS
jgi:hypothetical protein